MARLTFDRTIALKDILTSLSILVSIAALLFAWGQDRQIREREQADRIRAAAAETLAKVERWEELSLWFFQDIQPLYVETSEKFGMVQKPG